MGYYDILSGNQAAVFTEVKYPPSRHRLQSEPFYSM